MERSLGVIALDDREYALRDKWIGVAAELEGILQTIRWKHAKAESSGSPEID